jgi:hypothetical protein
MDADPLHWIETPKPTQLYVFGVAYFRRQAPLLVRIRDHSFEAAVKRVRQMHPQSQITVVADGGGMSHVVQHFQDQHAHADLI